ncbi:MAG: hypothetical protein JRN00_08110 [Nitrososphaerota archaeon]|nr:hypothetical protein [Nitrososphaerota archaeon]
MVDPRTYVTSRCMEVITMTTITQGEVYLEDEHVPLIKSEEEYVKQRYFTVARIQLGVQPQR